ncbi:hypothetical protein LJC56_06025 [Christensenellaceae bacterium OttesenSCG-928-K19]|nr:hypothetical protein [Christensenellaceae bacterium OttesenSCG-928-K19]
MKKLSALLLAVCICAGIAACATKDPATENLENPVVEVDSPEVIQKQLDIFILVPEGAENVRYSIISDEIAQADFTLDGVEYTERIQKTETLEDISGVYTTMEEEKDMMFSDYGYHIAYNADGDGISAWYDTLTGCSYSIYMKSGASESALQKVSEALIPAG